MGKIAILTATVFLMGTIGLGCDDDGPEGDEDVILGTITSLTGDLGSLGGDWRDACKLAVQEANAAGGPLQGRQIKLNVEDDATTPAGGSAAATKLVDAGALGVIGAPASGSTLEAVKITGPAKIPELSGTSTSPVLNALDGGEDSHPYFFRTVPADDLQGFVLGGLTGGAYNREGGLDVTCTRLAVVHIDNDYGNPFGEAITARYEDLGGTVVHDVAYAEGQPDYNTEVEGVIAATPDCIAMVGYPESGALIVNAWYTLGGDAAVAWFGTEGIKDPDFMEAITTHAEGFLGTAPASDPTRAQLQDFNQSFEAAFSREPQVFSDAIYDASAVLVLAIAQAGSTDGEAVREALFTVARFDEGDDNVGPGEIAQAIGAIQSGQGVNYDGAVGAVEFLDNGDVVGDYEIWRFSGDAFGTAASIRADDILEDMGE
jgi:ABC-type branched-subunit amino acid transport system substrate-binding protein